MYAAATSIYGRRKLSVYRLSSNNDDLNRQWRRTQYWHYKTSIYMSEEQLMRLNLDVYSTYWTVSLKNMFSNTKVVFITHNLYYQTP